MSDWGSPDQYLLERIMNAAEIPARMLVSPATYVDILGLRELARAVRLEATFASLKHVDRGRDRPPPANLGLLDLGLQHRRALRDLSECLQVLVRQLRDVHDPLRGDLHVRGE